MEEEGMHSNNDDEQKLPKKDIPKEFAGGAWKTHAYILTALIVVSTAVLAWCAMVEIIPLEVQMAANVALNWTALAYAIYIYKIYDDTRAAAVAKLEESGIEILSLEDGLSAVFTELKKFSSWFDNNKETLKKLQEKFKSVDIEKTIATLEEVSQFAGSLSQYGFTKERFEKLLIAFEKVDLDKVIVFVDDWNERDRIRKELDGNGNAQNEGLRPIPVAKEPDEPRSQEDEQGQPRPLPPLQRRKRGVP